jgi:catechol 2,3-dioxygenase-like lactoylglutathione lyase family enzyme
VTGPLAGAVLDHVGTEEPDIDARVAFLADVLGFRVLRWGTHVVTGLRIAMVADPRGTKLELMEVRERTGELDHVAYRVPDVDAAHAALLAAGCTELRAPFEIPAARARSSLLREAAGHQLQLITYQPDSPDLADPLG